MIVLSVLAEVNWTGLSVNSVVPVCSVAISISGLQSESVYCAQLEMQRQNLQSGMLHKLELGPSGWDYPNALDRQTVVSVLEFIHQRRLKTGMSGACLWSFLWHHPWADSGAVYVQALWWDSDIPKMWALLQRSHGESKCVQKTK